LPETKEEMYALIHEFDDKVDGMIKCIEGFLSVEKHDDFKTLDWAMLTVYLKDLHTVKSAYTYIDQILSSEEYQNREL